MILRYGQTWGQGTPAIKQDAMLDIRELLDYEVVKAYNTTEEDLEQVLIESVEYEEDGTEKKRFRPRRDAQGRLTDMGCVQGHGDEVQTLRDENLYMTRAFWGDGLMTMGLNEDMYPTSASTVFDPAADGRIVLLSFVCQRGRIVMIIPSCVVKPIAL